MNDARRGTLVGAAVAALGIGLSLAIFFRPQGLRAPAWVAYAAALAFVFAGCTLAARARGQHRLQRWLPVAVLACLTLPGVWLAAGPGPRRCGIALAHGLVTMVGVRPDLACRLAFGAGALIAMGLVLLAARHAIREDSRLR
jgi:hypothetical protein